MGFRCLTFPFPDYDFDMEGGSVLSTDVDEEREAYYKDDPKKALKKFFDREGECEGRGNVVSNDISVYYIISSPSLSLLLPPPSPPSPIPPPPLSPSLPLPLPPLVGLDLVYETEEIGQHFDKSFNVRVQ